jgi:hypothetical protein
LTDKHKKENLAILKKVTRMMNSRDESQRSESDETVGDKEIFDDANEDETFGK